MPGFSDQRPHSTRLPADSLKMLMESRDPIVGQIARHEQAIAGRMHSHPRAQLICTISTAADICVQSQRWTIKPGEAAWVPGGVAHSVSAGQPPMFQSIYIRPDLITNLQLPETVVPISTFLGELISRLAGHYHGQEDATTYPHLVQLVLSELRNFGKHRLSLPMPSNPRLHRICQTLTDDPGNRRTLAEWASLTGASRRRLERIFQNETGMSFSEWRQLRRIQAAAPLLRAGRPVQQVAWTVGYDSPSAFSAMFHKVTGIVPTALRSAVAVSAVDDHVFARDRLT